MFDGYTKSNYFYIRVIAPFLSIFFLTRRRQTTHMLLGALHCSFFVVIKYKTSKFQELTSPTENHNFGMVKKLFGYVENLT